MRPHSPTRRSVGSRTGPGDDSAARVAPRRSAPARSCQLITSSANHSTRSICHHRPSLCNRRTANAPRRSDARSLLHIRPSSAALPSRDLVPIPAWNPLGIEASVNRSLNLVSPCGSNVVRGTWLTPRFTESAPKTGRCVDEGFCGLPSTRCVAPHRLQ